MEKEIKKNGDIIKKALKKENNMSLSDMQRDIPLPIGQVRLAVAYLLGRGEIEETKYGLAKVYFLK